MPEVHVFRPDHQLFCRDCGEGELSGDHGIIAIDNGRQVYATPGVASLYAEYEPSVDDELEDDLDD